MTRQELIAKLKDIRSNGTELQIKLTASTLELQTEYDRVTQTSSLSSSEECNREDYVEPEVDNNSFGNVCLVTEPHILPEGTFEWNESISGIEEFRQLLDHSWESSNVAPTSVDVYSFAKQTVKRIAKLSHDWSMRECRGFMSLFGEFYKLTTRTPRRVLRRSKKFIADICKTSKGMIHAQYTRSF
jgi:hypothetical protein